MSWWGNSVQFKHPGNHHTYFQNEIMAENASRHPRI